MHTERERVRERDRKRERKRGSSYVCVSMRPHKATCFHSEDSEVLSLTVLGSFCLFVVVPGGR